MTKLVGAWGLGLLVLLPLLAPLAAAAPATFTVNVLTARSLGCSPDSWTDPDLRVRVYVNDVQVLLTEKGQDQDEPVFAAIAIASATLPATIGVEVEEAEPGGFFGFGGTTWVTCSLGPGGATRGTFTYHGESAKMATLRGEGEKAAEASLVVGTNPPPAPVVSANTTSSTITLQWAADPSGQAVTHRLAQGGAGAIVGSQTTPTSATVTGKCDNVEFTYRIIRDTPTWRVTSADVTARTTNVAPSAPRVLAATREGNVSVESDTAHDAARWEIHASAQASFTPSNATLRHTITPFFSARHYEEATGVSFQATDQHVLVRLVDTGGLWADSAPFEMGSPARTGGIFATRCSGTVTPTSPPGASPYEPPAQAPAPAPKPTPTPTPTPATTPTPDAERDECCYGAEISATVVAGAVRVAAGGTLDVTFRSTASLHQTLDVRLVDPAKSAAEQDGTILATVRLDPGEVETVTLTLRAPPLTPEGDADLRLTATIRESGAAQLAAHLALVMSVPRQESDLLDEDLSVVFQVKAARLEINASPGTLARIPVTLINKAGHPLRVTTYEAVSTRMDADIGRALPAHGFRASLSALDVTLDAYSKSEHVVLIDVPANATIGETVTASLGILVNNSVKEAALPASYTVHVVAAAAVDVDAGGLGVGALALGIAVAAGASVAVGTAVVMRRDSARFALAAALYTRFAKSEVLDHPARNNLRERIQNEPGVCFTDLQRATGLHTGAIVHHLRALEKAGVVMSRKEGAFRRFYVVGGAKPLVELHVSPLTPMQGRVLELIRAESLTQGQLAEKLGLSQQGTSHHVKALERAGHIEAYYDGRVWRYRIPGASEVVRP